MQLRCQTCLAWLAVQSIVGGTELRMTYIDIDTAAVAAAHVEDSFGVGRSDVATIGNSPLDCMEVPLSSTWTNFEVHVTDTDLESTFGMLDYVSRQFLGEPVAGRSAETLYQSDKTVSSERATDPWDTSGDERASFPTSTGYRRSSAMKNASTSDLRQVSNTVASQPIEPVMEGSSVAWFLNLSAPVLAIALAVGMMTVMVRKH